AASDSGPVVTFVDLESAGRGPAEWDLAIALDTLGELTRQWRTAQVVAEFVAGYRESGGPGRVSPAHLALRALVSGWQASAGMLARGDVEAAWAEARVHVERAQHWAGIHESRRGAA
ncbi:MAG: hypothetical protein WAR57_08120, partial [Candidatus Phosphoribacter sp.]